MPTDSRLPIPDSPHAAVLTPALRGAIATIGVRGEGAMELVGRRFAPAAGKPLTAFGAGRVVFGRFRTSADVAEDLVVGIVAVDEIEIHCHGGQAAIEAICDALVAEECKLVTAEAWAREVGSDALVADALVALTDARTEQTAAILVDQYRGALTAELRRIDDLLGRDQAAAKGAIARLLARAEVGLHLTQPWKIAITGAPNAGKSSLINAILGYERAIVFHQPGTTRDVLTAASAIGGWPVELADTAGLRAAADAIEAEGTARAGRQVAGADLVIFVVETTAAWNELQYESVRRLARRALIVAHNKCDLMLPPADGRPGGIEISAKTGVGIEALLAALHRSLVPEPPQRGEAVPFAAKQIGAVNEAAGYVGCGDLEAAQLRLAKLRLTGE